MPLFLESIATLKEICYKLSSLLYTVRNFKKPYRFLQMHWISAKFYEMDDILKGSTKRFCRNHLRKMSSQ